MTALAPPSGFNPTADCAKSSTAPRHPRTPDCSHAPTLPLASPSGTLSTMTEQDRVRLVVSREEAKLRIRARLVAGGELVRRGIASEKELGQVINDRKIWTDVTA